MPQTVYDVTTWPGASVSPYVDIGRVMNEIIADIKATQTTQTTRPGAVIYIPPGHFDLLTRVTIDISHLQIKGSGHGFLSEAIRDESNASQWVETLPGASHIRVKNTDGHNEAFLVARTGSPVTVGRLNSIEFRDFCIDGVTSSKPYIPGNGKTGILVQTDNDAFRIEGMGFVYLTHALVIHGADAPYITNNFIAECSSCIELLGASQVARITNNFLISAWAGSAVFAENAEGMLISGNSLLWYGSIRLSNTKRSSITANKFVSSWPGMVILEPGSDENLISSNQFFRTDTESSINNGKDDYFGLVHLNGNNNTVTANHFSYGVASQYIRPSGAVPTIVLVRGGTRNYLASNNIVSNVPVRVVLDASTTQTKVIYSAEDSQIQSFTTDYVKVPTP